MSIDRETSLDSQERVDSHLTVEKLSMSARLDVYQTGASLEIDTPGTLVDLVKLRQKLEDKTESAHPKALCLRGVDEHEVTVNIFVIDGHYVIKQGIPGDVQINVLKLPPDGIDLGEQVTIGQLHALPDGGTFRRVIGVAIECDMPPTSVSDVVESGKSPFERARDDIARSRSGLQ